MENAIQIFNFNSNTIRVIERDGDPWWVAKDVCDALGLSDVSMSVATLDDDEKLTQALLVSGQQRCVWLINEPGLYSLILRSRKPEAKAFKRWITHEVIPAIRKHGGYLTETKLEDILLSPEAGIKMLEAIKQEREAKIKAQQLNLVNRPKVRFADLSMKKLGEILPSDFASVLQNDCGLDVDAKRLCQWLRATGRFWKTKYSGGQHTNKPVKKYTEGKTAYFAYRLASEYQGKKRFQTFITPAGQLFLIDEIQTKRVFREKDFNHD